MIPAVLDFTWARPLDEARLETIRGVATITPSTSRLHPYRPLQEFSGLFLAFSETSPSADGAVGFASKFGMLWGTSHATPRATFKDATRLDTFDVSRLPTEPVDAWIAAIREMRRAVTQWQRAQAAPLELVSNPQALTFGTNKAALIRTIRQFVQKRIRHGITQWGDARPQFGDGGFVFVPNSLLGAMWFQFGDAVARDKRYRECRLKDDCTRARWFEVGTGVIAGAKREDSECCSKACKQKYHRMRKAEARTLHRSGLPPFTIARRLDTDTATVRGWLRRKER